MTLSGRVDFSSTWANAGVAPCYPGGRVAFTLKDAKGGIVAVWVNDTFDVRDLDVAATDAIPTKSTTSTHAFAPNMPTGVFDVFVSIGTDDGTPRIALPLSDGDNHRRYKLGTIEVTAEK